MSQFSLAKLLLYVALVCVVFAMVTQYFNAASNERTIRRLNKAAERGSAICEVQEKAINDAKFGTSLLYRLARNGRRHSDLFNFLDGIPPDQLSCSIVELAKTPSIRVVTYYSSSQSFPPKRQNSGEGKCAQLIIKSDSFGVVDYVMHDGKWNIGGMGDYPDIVASWQLPNNKIKKYDISTGGFSLLK